jgi:hypothetical protein
MYAARARPPKISTWHSPFSFHACAFSSPSDHESCTTSGHPACAKIAKALKAGTFKVNLVADGRVGEGEFIINGESEEVTVLPLDAVKVALKLEEAIDAPVVEEPAPEPVPEPAPVEEVVKAGKKKK